MEEPTCPNGTFSVGYNLDYSKDIYRIGLVIAGMLLLGTGMALVYRKTCLTGAIEGAPRLPVMEMDLNKAVAGVGMERGTNRKECKLAILKPMQPIIESWKSLWKG